MLNVPKNSGLSYFFVHFTKFWSEIHSAHINADPMLIPVEKPETSGSDHASWLTESCVDDDKAFAATHSKYTTPGGRKSHLTDTFAVSTTMVKDVKLKKE